MRWRRQWFKGVLEILAVIRRIYYFAHEERGNEIDDITLATIISKESRNISSEADTRINISAHQQRSPLSLSVSTL